MRKNVSGLETLRRMQSTLKQTRTHMYTLTLTYLHSHTRLLIHKYLHIFKGTMYTAHELIHLVHMMLAYSSSSSGHGCRPGLTSVYVV